jgi:hypothetical protein
MGVVRLGQRSEPVEATVTNTETFVYTIDRFELTDSSFVMLANTCTGAILAPRQSCSFTVVFQPRRVGPAEAEVSMRLNTFCGLRRDYFPCSYKSTGSDIRQNGNFEVEDLIGGLRRVRWTPDGLGDSQRRGGNTAFEGAGVG